VPKRPRVVCCPDKFRGSLSAPEAAAAMRAGVKRAGESSVAVVPLADGGEGTLEALLHARGGSARPVMVTGPTGKRVQATLGILPGSVAVVEAAQAAGIALVDGPNDPLQATSRGVGELIAAAQRGGAREIIVGVGGTACTDGGLPALDALGWSLAGLKVTVACDVTTAFVDAAADFGPQKGATPAQVALLERRLSRLSSLYQQRCGVDVSQLPGSGAAGGLAGGLAAIGAELVPGFEVVAEATRLDQLLEDAEVVLTGEGQLDQSSLEGKVVGNVVDLAKEYAVPHCGVIVGRIAPSFGPPEGAIVSDLIGRAFDEEDAFARAALLVEEAALDLGRRFLGG